MNNPDQEFDFPSLRKAIDSTMMLTLARFLMPIVLAVTGYLVTSAIDDLRHQLNKLTDEQAVVNVTTSGLIVKVDSAVKQLDRLQNQVDRQQHP